MKQNHKRFLFGTFRRSVAITLALILCAVTVLSVAETQNTDEKLFTLATAAPEVASDPDRPELSVKQIAKIAGASIVGITVESAVAYGNPFGRYGFDFYGFGGNREMPEFRRKGAGSGIIVSENGYILTNSHVVSGASEIKVILYDGTEYDATLVGQDQVNDVAVIKVDASDLVPALIGDSSLLEVGELAVAIGNPLGEVNGSVTAGIISALARSITIDGKPIELLQTDAAINPGNSGGALLNPFGEVIGLVTAKTSSVSVEGIGYAIPINNVKEQVEEIINTGGVRSNAYQGPMLGVTIRDVNAELSKQYGVPEGVYVVDVEPFSAAEQAGVRRGDFILSLAGEEIKTSDDLNRIKAEMELGVPQPLEVLRHGEKVELSVLLVGEQPTQL